jgi:hypothetical protein
MYSDMGGEGLREARTPRGLGGGGPDVGGWLAFAIAMLALSGVLSGLWGVLTLVRRGVFVATFKDNPLDLTYRVWGWSHIAVGVLAAVGIAALSIIANVLVIASYPVWFTIVIALDVLVIFAVTVHGTDVHPVPRR